MQADAFLFERAGRARRPRRGRGAHLRPHAALAAQARRGDPRHPARGGRDRRRGRWRTRSRPGARPKLAHIIPNFQNPAGCTLSLDKRQRLLELAREHDFTIFEDDPYVELRFEGEQHPTMLELDESDETRRLRLVVLEDGLPGHPGGLPGRPRRPDRRDPQARHRDLHLAEHGRPVDRGRVLSLGRASTARSPPSRTRCASAATPPAPRSAATCPTPASSRPRAATSSGSTCPRAATWRRSSAAPPSAASSS